MRVALAMAAALALFATGCGDADEPSASDDTVEERSSTTQAPEGTAPDDDDGEDDPAVVAELEQATLELSDLPGGWSTMPDDEDDEPEDESSDMADDCGIEGELLPDDVEPLGEVEREFHKGEVGPFLFVSVTRFAKGEAEVAMDALDKMATQCQEFTTTEDGVETSGTMQPLDAPSFGDETFAARLGIESLGMVGQGDIVAVRTGDDVLLMLGLSMSTILGDAPFDDGEYEQIVSAAVEKAFG